MITSGSSAEHCSGIPSAAAYASLLAFASQILSFFSSSFLLLSQFSQEAHLISLVGLQEQQVSVVYEEFHDANAHVHAYQMAKALYCARVIASLPSFEFVEQLKEGVNLGEVEVG